MDTINLFKYFGWSGGTIHAISNNTGIPVYDLIYKEFKADSLMDPNDQDLYELGKSWNSISIDTR